MNSQYNAVATFYDLLGYMWSGKGIHNSKLAHLNEINPGDRVFYAGAGAGNDVLEAARKGARVTVVEHSPKMIELIRKKLAIENLSGNVQLICGDVFDISKSNQYDMVVANYFLNVFSRPGMQQMLQHLITLIRPDGKLVIADFAPPALSIVVRFFQNIYYYVPAISFWILCRNPFHPIYDYVPLVTKSGLKEVSLTSFKVWGVGPKWFSYIRASKKI